MIKDNKTILEIFLEGLGIYLKHFPTLIKYMSFPVWGQILGFILALGIPIWFSNTYALAIQEPSLMFTLTMALCLPGLILFTKAFWEYLVAYVAINSMAENTVKSGRIYDINAHKKVATMSKRLNSFIILWLLFGIFTIVAILPPMWAFALIIFVYISLIFQVFTFEKTLTPVECFVRSKNLVFWNFWKTTYLLLVIAGVSYFLLPKFIGFVFELLNLNVLLNMFLDPIILTWLPINEWNVALATLNISYTITSLEITKMIVSTFISTIVIMYTLPLRSICLTLWYKQLSIKEIKAKSKKKKAKSENV